MSSRKGHLRELYQLFASVKSEKDAELLLQDLLTPQERDSLAERWQIVWELASGKPQRDVANDLGVSISKVTRGSRQLKYGKGGFTKFLKKLKK